VNLDGKAALITGGRRVGGVMLADRGVDVALTSKTSRAAIDANVAEAGRRGVRGLAVAADLADPAQAERAVAAVVGRYLWGRITAQPDHCAGGPVTVAITAVPSNGNLLGNLLAGLANLLNNPGNPTGGILSHLNGILGILRHA